MAEDQITSLVGDGVIKEIQELTRELENLHGQFKPLMEEIRQTTTTMGASSKDVRLMIEAYQNYNRVMNEGASATNRYNDVQSQIEAMQKRVAATTKEQLVTYERLKEQMRALEAEAKAIVTAEAAAARATENATRTKINAREEARRLTNEIKKQLDVQNGTITVNGKEELTLRAKSAMLAQLKNAYYDTSEAVRKQMIPQIKALDKELKDADSAIGNNTRNVGNYGSAFKGLIALTPGLSRFATGFGVLGIAVMGVSSALSAASDGIKYGINVNKEYEQANANLASILGVTRKETQQLQEQSLLLGRTTEWSATKVTEAQTELAKLGFSQNTIENMTKPLLGFATALDATLPQAAQVAGQTLRAFNKSSADTGEVLSLMTVAANKSAMDFSFLERSIAIVGASASVAKVPLKDTLALLGVLSNSGLDASRAATALRNIFLYLVDDSKKLGKELKGTEMNASSISKAFIELRKKGVDLADMFELTDKRAVNALAVLIQNAEQITKLRDAISDTTGALEVLRRTRLDTLEGDMKLMGAAWDAFWLSFRDNMPILRSGIQWITEKMNEITDLRNASNKKQEGSQSYGEDFVNQSRIDVRTKKAQEELQVLSEQYNKALSVSVDEADKVMKKILAKREELINQYAGSSKKALTNYYATISNVDSRIGSGDNEFQTNIVSQIKAAHDDLKKTVSNVESLRGRIAYNKGISEDTKYSVSTREAAATNVDKLQKELERQQKLTQKAYVNLNTAYEEGTKVLMGAAGSKSNQDFRKAINLARTNEREAYGKYLTESRLFESVSGVISENERTMTPQASGGSDKFKVDTGRKSKAQIEAERVQRKLDELANAEELAEYTKWINEKKRLSNELKSMSQDETVMFELRTAAIEEMAKAEKDIASKEYERASRKLEQGVMKDRIGLTGKVVNQNVIDPITGKPQTDVEKAVLKQRLALYAEYTAKKADIDGDALRATQSLEDKRDAEIKKGIAENLSDFKKGLDQRLKDIEEEKQKEQNKLATLYGNKTINKTVYKDESAALDVRYANTSKDQIQMYYTEWLKKLDLPEELKQQLEDVFKKHATELSTNVQKAETKYKVHTGTDYNQSGRRTVGTVWRSLFGGGVKKDKEGKIDVEGSTNPMAKASGAISSVVNSDVVQQSTKLFSSLTDVMTSYYDQQIQKVDELMAKQQEQYEKEKQLLDDSLTNLNNNHDAGLLSDANFNAQKRQNELSQKSLDKKNEAEKDALEKKKRKLQMEQAKWQKANSYVQAVMSTATGVATALTLVPPLGLIMAALVGTMGAAQIALIASQTIPQYARGTSDHKGGGMIVGDGGVPEYVLTPNNTLAITPSKPTYMEAPKHTKVFKNDKAFLRYLEEKDIYVDRNMPINVNIDTDYKEQKALLKGIEKGIGRLNKNELHRIELERNRDFYKNW